jgi:hypothetical protein
VPPQVVNAYAIGLQLFVPCLPQISVNVVVFPYPMIRNRNRQDTSSPRFLAQSVACGLHAREVFPIGFNDSNTLQE